VLDSTSVNLRNIIFPKVNYIGNKNKLADWIAENIPITEGKVLDLFAGGSSVSFALKKKKYTVISNDSLYASYVVNKALIENKEVKLDENRIDEALKAKYYDEHLRKNLNWLSNNLYYAEEVDELTNLVNFSKVLTGYEKYMYLSLLRRAMIRKLPYSRMNLNWKNIKKLRNEEYSYEKYGRRRAYHNQKFSHHMLAEVNSYNKAIFDNGMTNHASQLDAITALKEYDSYDVVYLDPPYPGTMNNYDGFYGSFDKMFKKDKVYTDWTKPDNFLKLLKKALEVSSQKAKYLILSINSNTKPGIEQIIDVLKSYGVVEIKERKHNYQVSGKVNKNKNIELLIILEFKKSKQLTIFNYL